MADNAQRSDFASALSRKMALPTRNPSQSRNLLTPQILPRLPRLVQLCAPLIWIAGLYSLMYHADEGIEHALNAFLLDVGVFQDAGKALMDGNSLYSDDFPTRSGFRFIYPPFAAGLFVPLGFMQEDRMEVWWTLASYAAVFGVIAMAVYRAGLGRVTGPEGSKLNQAFGGKLRWLSHGTWWLWALALTGFAISLEPIESHVMYGQINIFLILLVTADVLGFTPRKLRGLGIGLAAGIKITPAAYAVIFLARKDWWSLARSVGFFVLTALIGWVLRPSDSLYFWTTEFFASDRGGPPLYPPNQALTGLLSRAGMDQGLAQMIMGPGFIVIALLCIWGAMRLERAGRPVDSLLLVVLGIVVASPLAVTHHWAGVVLLLVVLFRPLNWAILGTAALSIYAHYEGLHVMYGNKYELHPELQGMVFPEYFQANAQGLTGVLMLVVLLVTALRAPKVTDSGAADSVNDADAEARSINSTPAAKLSQP
ncbi:glycosyltransferase 87 family protein [Corynebacterium suicordis]|uniref:glycosyltransferase 87 family protein n=1 Tax=uncultured Corynebacterium sp. TaxID=159447 RepID=UPI0025972767|nr:glycosyltransferase 87 family protein [uncultured Corynebacterium sp.]